MFKWIKFKAYDLVLFLILLTIRITLRIVYGKSKRNELILSGRVPLYQIIMTKFSTHRWQYIWSHAISGSSSWEPEVSRLLSSIKGELFVDIGAGLGYYTLLLANNFKEVLAVEPEPNNASKLRLNTLHLGNVCIVQEAISNTNGETRLYINQHNIGGHTIIPQSNKSNELYPISTKVKVITLEALLEGRIASLVKVDTEGAELKILDGTPPNSVKAWLIESHFGESRKKELDLKLSEMGYETSWITKSHIYAHMLGGEKKRINKKETANLACEIDKK